MDLGILSCTLYCSEALPSCRPPFLPKLCSGQFPCGRREPQESCHSQETCKYRFSSYDKLICSKFEAPPPPFITVAAFLKNRVSNLPAQDCGPAVGKGGGGGGGEVGVSLVDFDQHKFRWIILLLYEVESGDAWFDDTVGGILNGGCLESFLCALLDFNID